MKKPKDKTAPTMQSGLFISEYKGQNTEPECPVESTASPPMADAYDVNSQTEDIFQQYKTRIFFPMAIPLIDRRK